MLAHMQETIPIDVPSSHASSYALGPIDPTHLLTLPARLSDGQDISLLVPTHLSLSLLTDPQFKDGYEWGCLRADIEEGWTIPHMVNHIYLTLRTELWGECSLSASAWGVGFLLGNLAGLAETERTLALVGIAHLRFLLACVSLDAWLSDNSYRLIQQMDFFAPYRDTHLSSTCTSLPSTRHELFRSTVPCIGRRHATTLDQR